MNAIRIFPIALPLCLALTGCAGNNKAQTQQQFQRAYLAGEEAARAQMQQQMQQNAVPQVHFLGPFKNPVLIWSEGLTLAHALVQADYQSQATPLAITIYRGSEIIRIDPQRVLQGEDYPLAPGDTVVVQN